MTDINAMKDFEEAKKCIWRRFNSFSNRYVTIDYINDVIAGTDLGSGTIEAQKLRFLTPKVATYFYTYNNLLCASIARSNVAKSRLAELVHSAELLFLINDICDRTMIQFRLITKQPMDLSEFSDDAETKNIIGNFFKEHEQAIIAEAKTPEYICWQNVAHEVAQNLSLPKFLSMVSPKTEITPEGFTTEQFYKALRQTDIEPLCTASIKSGPG